MGVAAVGHALGALLIGEPDPSMAAVAVGLELRSAAPAQRELWRNGQLAAEPVSHRARIRGQVRPVASGPDLALEPGLQLAQFGERGLRRFVSVGGDETTRELLQRRGRLEQLGRCRAHGAEPRGLDGQLRHGPALGPTGGVRRGLAAEHLVERTEHRVGDAPRRGRRPPAITIVRLAGHPQLIAHQARCGAERCEVDGRGGGPFAHGRPNATRRPPPA